MNKNKYEPAGRSFTEVIRNILNEPPMAMQREVNYNKQAPSTGDLYDEENSAVEN